MAITCTVEVTVGASEPGQALQKLLPESRGARCGHREVSWVKGGFRTETWLFSEI
jgi:hypothetical protein